MNLDQAIKKMINDHGADILKERRLVSMLSDLQAFGQLPYAANMLKQIYANGYGTKIHKLYNNQDKTEVAAFQSELRNKLGFDMDMLGKVLYAFSLPVQRAGKQKQGRTNHNENISNVGCISTIQFNQQKEKLIEDLKQFNTSLSSDVLNTILRIEKYWDEYNFNKQLQNYSAQQLKILNVIEQRFEELTYHWNLDKSFSSALKHFFSSQKLKYSEEKDSEQISKYREFYNARNELYFIFDNLPSVNIGQDHMTVVNRYSSFWEYFLKTKSIYNEDWQLVYFAHIPVYIVGTLKNSRSDIFKLYSKNLLKTIEESL